MLCGQHGDLAPGQRSSWRSSASKMRCSRAPCGARIPRRTVELDADTIERPNCPDAACDLKKKVSSRAISRWALDERPGRIWERLRPPLGLLITPWYSRAWRRTRPDHSGVALAPLTALARRTLPCSSSSIFTKPTPSSLYKPYMIRIFAVCGNCQSASKRRLSRFSWSAMPVLRPTVRLRPDPHRF